MTRIFTKTGDKGTTSLCNGTRVSKTDIRIEANGCLDELNAILGLIKATLSDSDLTKPTTIGYAQKLLVQRITTMQHNIMDIMAHVAGNDIDTSTIEQTTADYEAEMTAYDKPFCFDIPGASVLNALLHLARSKARTCERRLWQVCATEQLNQSVMTYINRLSDYLFYYDCHLTSL